MTRGEIWLINLDPTLGAEIRKTRPAVIVSVDAVGVLPLRVVVPITSWKEHYAQAPWMVRIDPDPQNGLDKVSCADTLPSAFCFGQSFRAKFGQVRRILDAGNRKGFGYRSGNRKRGSGFRLMAFGWGILYWEATKHAGAESAHRVATRRRDD